MRIYEASILALKELDKPSTVEEILDTINKNGWYIFNTSNEVAVLKLQIKRHMKGYTGTHSSKDKYFIKIDNKFDLLSNVEKSSPLVLTESEQSNWIKKREDYLEEIRDFFRRDQLSLFIGSGVSTSAGFPGWGALLDKLNASLIRHMCSKNFGGKLFEKKIDEREKKSLTELLKHLNDDSPITNAYFLESALNSPAAFSKRIREALYGKRQRKYTSETLVWLAKLCNHRGKYRIRSVVTFNFDDLLEQHLRDIPVDHKPVFRENDEINPNELPVFHVHGYLPQNDSSYDDLKDNLIVFSEQAYHTIYTDSYSWSNIIQLYVLKENVCLFIGLSMKDPNMRRILDISARRNANNIKHFALMQRIDMDEIEERDLNKLNLSPGLTECFMEDFHSTREKAFEKLGIRIVWYEDHAEIPGILKKIVTD
ncbi:MAG: SIR2 family protein [Anaerobacillus sp.]|uniref:SIR2 family protein n=1 Tax=Anaerobacillus sp. TaxID=1872506 RepID=UPI003919274A